MGIHLPQLQAGATSRRTVKAVGALAACLALAPLALVAQDWPTYGGPPGGTRYSALDQIRPENLSRLEIAWTYRTGALEPKSHLNRKAAFESTPVLADGKLLLTTPFDRIIALEPETGGEIWAFDPDIDRSRDYSEVTSRGVAVWRGAGEGACSSRVFVGTIDARLIAVDLASGKLCRDFGEGGSVNLEADIDLKDRGDYQVTSPPAILGDRVIVGSSLGDNRRARLESGAVRAFDVRTGKQAWRWDPLPADLETGAANAWAPASVDPERDLVFVPTGSASPDFYGGMRPGDDRWANSVVALRGSTGKLVWGFQVVHHDLWDYDVAAQPALIDIERNGERVAAVAVNTKMGHLFVLDRETGKPLLPVEERETPPSSVKGEKASPTQPFPSNPPLAATKLTASDMFGATPDDVAWCKKRFSELDYQGVFTPPSERGTLLFPGNVGGVNWGGAAFDPKRGVVVAVVNRLPTAVTVLPRDQFDKEVNSRQDNRISGEFGRQQGAPYGMYRESFLGPSGVPCIAPPWGLLTAVKASTGEILWSKPIGEIETPARQDSGRHHPRRAAHHGRRFGDRFGHALRSAPARALDRNRRSAGALRAARRRAINAHELSRRRRPAVHRDRRRRSWQDRQQDGRLRRRVRPAAGLADALNAARIFQLTSPW